MHQEGHPSYSHLVAELGGIFAARGEHRRAVAALLPLLRCCLAHLSCLTGAHAAKQSKPKPALSGGEAWARSNPNPNPQP
eukprot:scaffold32161_cov45-Phaeocystis_antarctica.AAC.1